MIACVIITSAKRMKQVDRILYVFILRWCTSIHLSVYIFLYMFSTRISLFEINSSVYHNNNLHCKYIIVIEYDNVLSARPFYNCFSLVLNKFKYFQTFLYKLLYWQQIQSNLIVYFIIKIKYTILG